MDFFQTNVLAFWGGRLSRKTIPLQHVPSKLGTTVELVEVHAQNQVAAHPMPQRHHHPGFNLQRGSHNATTHQSCSARQCLPTCQPALYITAGATKKKQQQAESSGTRNTRTQKHKQYTNVTSTNGWNEHPTSSLSALVWAVAHRGSLDKLRAMRLCRVCLAD